MATFHSRGPKTTNITKYAACIVSISYFFKGWDGSAVPVVDNKVDSIALSLHKGIIPVACSVDFKSAYELPALRKRSLEA